MIKTKEVIREYLNELNQHHIESVLDLGCGSGRISLKFAEKGIKTVGIDCTEKKISNKNFSFVKKDLREFDFNEKYDLIIASLILHFFNYRKAVELINKMKDNTNKGGFNFLICMSNEDDLSKEKKENFYPDINSLKKIYSDWKIIKECQDFTEMENHDNLGEHKHNLIFLIIKK